jgi:hypothetical protein
MKVWLLLIFATATQVGLFGADMSAEEVAVRSLYSAVVLRSQFDSLLESYSKNEISTEKQLSIQLSDLQQGTISEIASSRISDLVTVPTGELLIVAPVFGSFSDRRVGQSLQVHWGPVNRRYGFGSISMFDRPLSELLQAHLAEAGIPYDRYVAYTVSAELQGKSRIYKAVALFRKGERAVHTVDYVLGQTEGMVADRLIEDFMGLPASILNANEINLRKLDELFRSVSIAGDCAEDATTKLCCDPATKRCGIPERAFAGVLH